MSREPRDLTERKVLEKLRMRDFTTAMITDLEEIKRKIKQKIKISTIILKIMIERLWSLLTKMVWIFICNKSKMQTTIVIYTDTIFYKFYNFYVGRIFIRRPSSSKSGWLIKTVDTRMILLHSVYRSECLNYAPVSRLIWYLKFSLG